LDFLVLVEDSFGLTSESSSLLIFIYSVWKFKSNAQNIVYTDAYSFLFNGLYSRNSELVSNLNWLDVVPLVSTNKRP
jgi:hypothetical protein